MRAKSGTTASAFLCSSAFVLASGRMKNSLVWLFLAMGLLRNLTARMESKGRKYASLRESLWPVMSLLLQESFPSLCDSFGEIRLG